MGIVYPVGILAKASNEIVFVAGYKTDEQELLRDT